MAYSSHRAAQLWELEEGVIDDISEHRGRLEEEVTAVLWCRDVRAAIEAGETPPASRIRWRLDHLRAQQLPSLHALDEVEAMARGAGIIE